MSFYNILSVSLRIFKQIRRDRRTLGLMIVAPILVTLLFSWAFSGEITNVPVALYNGDLGLREEASDYIIAFLGNNSNMNITINDSYAFNFLGSKYHAVIVLPENLTTGLVISGTAKISIYINVTTSYEANLLTQYLVNNISDALISFLNVNKTNIEINQTIQFPSAPPPLNYYYNVCILDYDLGFKTIIGELITEKLDSNSDINLRITDDANTCYDYISTGKAILSIVIPENFTTSLLLRKEAKIISYVNGVEKQEVETAFKAISDAIDEVVVEIFGKKSIEFSREYVYGSADILMIDFFAPSYLGFIGMFFAFIISGVLFLRERMLGTLERMLASALTHTEIILGYLLTFTIVATLQTLLIVLTTLLFSTQILQHFLFIYFLVLLIAMGSVSLSIFLSSYMKTELQVIQMIPIFIIPQLFLSGLIVPLRSFPAILIPLAYVLPLTYYVEAVKRITFMNASIFDIWLELAVLVAYFLLGIILSIKKFRREIV